MDHPLPPQHRVLRAFLRRHGAHAGCTDISVNPDETTTIDFGDHGQVHGPTQDIQVWESALELAQAVCYDYHDLPEESSTRQVLNRLTHPGNEAMLSDARRAVEGGLRPLGDYVRLAMGPDKARKFDLVKVADVVKASHRAVLAREDLGVQAAQVDALRQNLERALNGGEHAQAKMIAAALSTACDELREQINALDDAAEHLVGGG